MTLLLGAALPGSVHGQLTLSTCLDKMKAGDDNKDGVLNKVEYMNFLVRASPYGTACPDMRIVGDFIEGGKYFEVLERASCFCQDYDEDDTCCGKPTLRVDDLYPPAYGARVCQAIADIIESSCNAPPTQSPTLSPTESPTESPVEDIVNRPDTTAPTVAPTTTAPTEAPTANINDQDRSPSENLDLPRYKEEDDTPFRPLPVWMIIAIPCVCIVLILAFLLARDVRRRKKKNNQEMVTKSVSLEEEDHDSMSGYPDILEETDVDDTERSMEEGQIITQASEPKPISKPKTKSKSKSSHKSKSKKKAPKQDTGTPPKSPSRMNQLLDSLDLEETARAASPSKKKKATKKSKKGVSDDALDSDRKMSEFGDTLDHDKRAKRSLKADLRNRNNGSLGKDSASASVSDASSTELFFDETDDASANSGTAESNARIKWRLLHPSTMVSTGAVEVFPLPPANPTYVVSSSSSSPSTPDSWESKEEVVSDEDSVSDVYVADDDESEDTRDLQPDPDGVRLEDGRHYREQWRRENRVRGW